MSWLKVDDQASSHPKFLAAGYHAWGTWESGGQWSCRYLADGFIPASALPTLAPLPVDELVGYMRALVASGLWHDVYRGVVIGCEKCTAREATDKRLTRTAAERAAMNGWLMHDFLDYNPARSQVLKRRKTNADRQRHGRAGAGAEAFEWTDSAPVEAPVSRTHDAHSHAVTKRTVTPLPTRPLSTGSKDSTTGTGRDGTDAPRTPEELRALIESAIPGYTAWTTQIRAPAAPRKPAARMRGGPDDGPASARASPAAGA